MTTTPKPCPHPPARLYTGVVHDPVTNTNKLWVACCQCGGLLRSGYSAALLGKAA